MTDNDPLNLYPLPGSNKFEQLSEIRDVTCGALSVVVDFNDLLADKGDDAYEIVAKLRDLLR